MHTSIHTQYSVINIANAPTGVAAVVMQSSANFLLQTSSSRRTLLKIHELDEKKGTERKRARVETKIAHAASRINKFGPADGEPVISCSKSLAKDSHFAREREKNDTPQKKTASSVWGISQKNIYKFSRRTRPSELCRAWNTPWNKNLGHVPSEAVAARCSYFKRWLARASRIHEKYRPSPSSIPSECGWLRGCCVDRVSRSEKNRKTIRPAQLGQKRSCCCWRAK
jgi:hypothetical protein